MKNSLILKLLIAGVGFLSMTVSHGQEMLDLRSAEMAVAADLAMSTNPKTRTRCSEIPCLGVSQAELGLALVASRNTSASLNALAALIRFRLDGGLGEDFSCLVTKKGQRMRSQLISMNPNDLRNRCASNYVEVTRGHSSVFLSSDTDTICRSVKEILEAREELVKALNSKRSCQY